MFAWSNLDSRLSGVGEAPESESHTVAEIVARDFGEAGTGSFMVVYEAPSVRWRSPAFVKAVRASVRDAARAAAGRSSPLVTVSPRVSYAALPTDLPTAAATERASAIKQAAGQVPGARVQITGFPIVSTELSSIMTHDLRRAEMVAIPITAVILLLLFGSLPAVAVPLLFALTTISVAMGLVWLEAAFVEIPVYATSVVTLVGIALAVDYSMLYVSRYREEVRCRAPDQTGALHATTRTAGRALAISGLVVAAGLLPMVLIPIPFFSGLGLAAVGIPVTSVLAAATLLPALLELLGPRLERLPVRVPRRLRLGSSNRPLSDRLATMVIGRPLLSAITAGAVMVLIALPALGISLTGGSAEFLRLAHLPSESNGADEGAVLAPSEVLIDSGRASDAWAASTLAAERHLVARLAADSTVTTVQAPSALAGARLPGASVRRRAERLGLVNGNGRFARIRITSSEESGSRPADALVERLRRVYVPAADFGTMAVRVGGVAARDYDFVHAITASVPPFAFVLAIVMFLLLAAMLGSMVLPLKAIAMSALSVAAACGVLVLVFQLGWGTALGLGASDRIVAWVPVLLFAAMFGISTDYEIFMVTRMREEWRHSGNNRRAILVGLHQISGVVTASALVMIVIFAGFTTSRVVALQQFGVGLVAGVFLDATVIRLVLVPSLMVLFGRWNWTFAAPVRTTSRSRSEPEEGHESLTRTGEGG
ncbi:MAG TPA: MMPL family transporter [Solirubrobacterales bacterium]|jgi:RND superfamily putative drug exporter